MRSPPTPNALEYVFTHEAGHFLGLAHSPDASAVMFAQYYSGRSTGPVALASDDERAICSIYPKNKQRDHLDASGNDVSVAASACSFTTGAACGPATIDHGCSIGAPGAAPGVQGAADGTPRSLLALAAAFAALGLRARARSLRRSRATL